MQLQLSRIKGLVAHAGLLEQLQLLRVLTLLQLTNCLRCQSNSSLTAYLPMIHTSVKAVMEVGLLQFITGLSKPIPK